jgi:gliding motility-associated-like protein
MKPHLKMLILLLSIHFCGVLNAKNILNNYAVAPPAATITVNTSSICKDGTNPVITFTGKDGTAPYTFIYTINGGTPQTIKTLGGNSSITVTVPTNTVGIYEYKLVSVTDTNGTQAETASVKITVNAVPAVDFTFNNDDTCSGTTIQFTDATAGTGSYTYLWDFGKGDTSTLQNPVHTFNELGCGTATIAVKLTVTDGDCTFVKIKNIKVRQKPNINFKDMDPTSTPSTQFSNCANASFASTTYSITVGNISVTPCAATYSINWGDGTIENNISLPLSHTYLKQGVFSMIISVMGTNGCINAKNYLVKNISNPSGGILSPGGTTDMCIPTPVIGYSIGAWATNSPGTTYSVDYGDGSPLLKLSQDDMIKTSYFNAANPSASENYPVPYSYNSTSCPKKNFTIKLTVSNACKTTQGSVDGGNTISTAKADFTAPATACTTSDVLFTNTTIMGYSADCLTDTDYTWDFGDPASGASNIINTGFVTIPANANHTFSAPGTYTVKLTANSGGKCLAFPPKTQTICISPPLTTPTISLTPSNAANCAPLTVNASTPNIATNCASPTEYLWIVTKKNIDCDLAASNPTYLNSTTSTSQNPVFNFTNPGEYSISLKTKNSCGEVESAVQKLIVKKPPKVTVAPIANLCGGTTGTTIIKPTATIDNCGFTNAELVYNWSFPGGTPATSSDIAPQVSYTTGGSKTVSLFISVVGGCADSVTSSRTFAIGTAPTLAALNPPTQSICSGAATVAVPLVAETGSTFSWNATTVPAGVTLNTNSGIGNTIPALTISNSTSSAKTVILTITSTLSGCPSTTTYNIVVNPGPTLTQPIGSTICSGGTITPLTVTVNPTPAAGTATYKWYSNATASTNVATATLVNTSTVDGNYTPPDTVGTIYYFCEITFSSSGSCPNIKSNAVAITVNASATINPQPIQSQNICIGSTLATPLTSNYIGGTGTATYKWYKNTVDSTVGGIEIAGATASSYTPPVFNAPETAYYHVTITFSGSGCGSTSSDPAEVKVFADPTISSILPASQSLCSGVTPTNLSVVATGEPSLGDVKYQWFSNTVNSNAGGNSISGAITASFTPPTNNAGTTYYYCTVSQNGVGCETRSATVSVTVNLAAQITKQPQSNTICLGDTPKLLEVAFINGVGIPQYQWYSNSTNSIVGSTLIVDATNPKFSPPATVAGTVYYYCKITLSSGGCSDLNSDIVEVTITQNPVITNKTSIICSGKTFSILPINSGAEIVPTGTTYTWSNPTINPPNSITGASSQTIGQTEISQNLINTTINPATVTYTVTPIVGVCTGANFTVTITVNPAISNAVTIANSGCFGGNNGSIQSNIVGGIPFSSGSPYQISWTGPNSFVATNTTISNLAPGVYNLTVTDDGGCPFSETYTITEPDDIIITTDLEQDITCFQDADGKIEITVTGGASNYVYTWTKDGNPFSNAADISNLSPATYTVSVTDSNNCGPKTATFTITEPPILAINLLSKTDILCFGDSTGAITINAKGGTPIEVSAGIFDYNYSWKGPNGFASSSQNLTGIPAGTYDLIVTDNSGCTQKLSVTLTETSEIKITATKTISKCYGDNDAKISVVLSGGLAPYKVSWNNFAEGLILDNLSAGDYLITVEDALGCVKTLNINIPSPPIFTINPVVKNISCFGAKDGSIELNFVGGVAPISFVWTDNPTAGTIRNNLPPGSYTVNITDKTLCSINQTSVIVEPKLLILSANIKNALDCNDANSGAINLIVAGGSPPYTYAWSNGAITEDLVNITTGNYLVKVTDANGCSKQAQYSINRPDPIVTSVDTKTDYDCATKNVKQSFVANIAGGVPPYILSWSSGTVIGANNEVMNTNKNGTVILNVTDAVGCTSSYTFNVKLPILGTPSFDISSFGYSSFGIYSISDPIQFTNTATGDFVSVIWDFGDGTTSAEINPVHTFVNPKEYVITQTVSYPFGCVYVKKITINIEKGYVLVVPTAFTPNNDTVNDTFRPVTKGLKNVRLDIYDTWGAMIYSEKGDVMKGWDGKIKNANAENGNYYYKVSAETFYGTIVNENSPFVLIK